jgi:hypothetical protein
MGDSSDSLGPSGIPHYGANRLTLSVWNLDARQTKQAGIDRISAGSEKREGKAKGSQEDINPRVMRMPEAGGRKFNHGAQYFNNGRPKSYQQEHSVDHCDHVNGSVPCGNLAAQQRGSHQDQANAWRQAEGAANLLRADHERTLRRDAAKHRNVTEFKRKEKP